MLGEKTKPYMAQNDKIIEDLRVSKPANANLAHYLSKQVGFPVHRNTKVTYFRVGEEKFAELKRQLESAKHYIFMEYFIVEEGIMWDSILDILKRKVEEGVEVRFMYDGMCSIGSFFLINIRKNWKKWEFVVKCSARLNRCCLHIRTTEMTENMRD